MIMIIILRPFMIRSDTIYHILLEHVLVLVYSTVCTCVRYKIIYIYIYTRTHTLTCALLPFFKLPRSICKGETAPPIFQTKTIKV